MLACIQFSSDLGFYLSVWVFCFLKYVFHLNFLLFLLLQMDSCAQHRHILLLEPHGSLCLGLPSVSATQQVKVYYSSGQGVADDFVSLFFLQVKQKPAEAVRKAFFLACRSLMQTSGCVVRANRNHQSRGGDVG